MHIVLVHGAGGTSATWSAVTPLLEARGHTFTLVDNPSQSLESDIHHTSGVVNSTDGPVLLVGHSYGGAVITNVGAHSRVAGLVYIAAFAPEEGESVQAIVNGYEQAEISKYMQRGPDGEWATSHSEAFWDEIGWDVPEGLRASLLAESRDSANAIFTQVTGSPAWRVRPSWYMVASADKTLRPEIQRDMAARSGAVVSEVTTSHFTPHVAAAEVVDLIETAVASLSLSLS